MRSTLILLVTLSPCHLVTLSFASGQIESYINTVRRNAPEAAARVGDGSGPDRKRAPCARFHDSPFPLSVDARSGLNRGGCFSFIVAENNSRASRRPRNFRPGRRLARSMTSNSAPEAPPASPLFLPAMTPFFR